MYEEIFSVKSRSSRPKTKGRLFLPSTMPTAMVMMLVANYMTGKILVDNGSSADIHF